MSSYTVQPGDTFDTVARKQYGDDLKSPLVRRANPGTSEPLVAGQSLIIPPDPDAVGDTQGNTAASEPNEVTLRIAGKVFRFWLGVSVTRTLDAVSTVQFDAPFTPEDPAFRDNFKPFSFVDVDIDVGGVRLFTGTMINPAPVLNPTSRTVSVSCYARPGVLGDCTAPASAYPLQWDESTLATIAEKFAGFFGLGVQFDADPGPTFIRVMAEPSEVALPFLAGLAAQRGLVMSDTPGGKVLFHRAVEAGAPVVDFTEGLPPLVAVTPMFNPQDYYSHVTGIGPTVIGLPGQPYTVKNTRLNNVVRPYTFSSEDTPDASVQQSVETKAGRMFANAVSYEVEVPTWRDPSGNLWTPNTLVTLLAEGAMVYTRSTFVIRSVTLTKTPTDETAVLTLILPGALAGKIPERLPWE